MIKAIVIWLFIYVDPNYSFKSNFIRIFMTKKSIRSNEISLQQSNVVNTEKYVTNGRVIAAAVVFATTIFSSDNEKMQFTALARNLPEYNGATGAKRGTAAALQPILKMNENIDKALEFVSLKSNNFPYGCVNNGGNICKVVYQFLDSSEKDFKRLFDEYSEGVSYKQQYLDKNAFLVYYTQGFDGVNRESIESDSDGSMAKMTMQYGYRNDAWVAMNDAISELKYIQETLQSMSNSDSDGTYNIIEESKTDLIKALKSTSLSIQQYISLVPSEQLAEAKSLLRN